MPQWTRSAQIWARRRWATRSRRWSRAASAIWAANWRCSMRAAPPHPRLRALARRLIALAEMRADIDKGEPVEAVMKRHRVFFRDEAKTARALRRWTPAMLARALTRIRAAERAVMAPGNAGAVLAEAEATIIAQGIARRG